MLASLTELRGYRVRGREGDLGRIDDVVLGRDEWMIRYMVVEMEESARAALLLAARLGRLNRGAHTLSCDVGREQVDNAPPTDRAQPMDRREEERLHAFYGWPPYWLQEEQEISPPEGLWTEQQTTEDPDDTEFTSPQPLLAGDLVEIYHVQAEGGEVGMLQDIVVEDEVWSMSYAMVNVADALPEAKRVLIATDYIQTVDPGDRHLYVSLPLDLITSSPALHSGETVTSELGSSLRKHYDRHLR